MLLHFSHFFGNSIGMCNGNLRFMYFIIISFVTLRLKFTRYPNAKWLLLFFSTIISISFVICRALVVATFFLLLFAISFYLFNLYHTRITTQANTYRFIKLCAFDIHEHCVPGNRKRAAKSKGIRPDFMFSISLFVFFLSIVTIHQKREKEKTERNNSAAFMHQMLDFTYPRDYWSNEKA